VNVAVVVAGSLTETLQAAPLIGALAGADGDVFLAAPPSSAQLGAGFRGVKEVIPLAALASRTLTATVPLAIAALRHRRIDAALICSDRPRERVLVYAAGCARRIGPSAGILDVLLTSRVTVDLAENRGRLWLRLGERLGLTLDGAEAAFEPPAEARGVAEQLLLGGGFEDGRLLVALAPGAAYGRGAEGFAADELRWDVERYAHLANQISHRHGAGVVILGEPGDRGLVDTMLLDVEADSLDLCGQLSLLETAAVVQRCDLVVSGDTPLLHLAAAVGTPSIGIFGPTDGRRRGPWGSRHRVVQAIAGRSPVASLQRVRVDDVLAGIESGL
jgi:lipopolysaccharide heptosyltransferase II